MNSPNNKVGSIQVFKQQSHINKLNRDAKILGVTFPAGTHNMVKLTGVLFAAYLWILAEYTASDAKTEILYESTQVKAMQTIAYFLPIVVNFIGRVVSDPKIGAIVAGMVPYTAKRVSKISRQTMKGNYNGVRKTLREGMVPNIGNVTAGILAAGTVYKSMQAAGNIISSSNPILKSLGVDAYEKFTRDIKTIANNSGKALKLIKNLNKTVRLPTQPLNTRAFSGMLIRTMESVLVYLLNIVRTLLGSVAIPQVYSIVRTNNKKIQEINN